MVLWNWIILLPLTIGLMVTAVNFIFKDLHATELDFSFSSSGFIWTLILSALLILYTLATFIPNLSLVVEDFMMLVYQDGGM